MDKKILIEELKKQSSVPELDLEIFDVLRGLLPMVAVELLVVRKEGEFGLKKKKVGEREGWALPGGFIGFNETFERACQRIAQKELDVEIDNLKFRQCYNWPEGSVRPAKGHAVTLLFQCQTKTPSNRMAYFQKIPKGVLAHHQIMLEENLDK